MNTMRERAKEYFPSVLLTLLSIVQAVALELLWSHLNEAYYLFEVSWVAAVAWAQILGTFLGLILIWVVYASNVMRFRWTPVTSDSIYPFLIGLVEFMLIASLEPGETGQWLLLMAVIFATMNWVGHTNMRRARQDSDNAFFFASRKPATLRDFAPQMLTVALLVGAGLIIGREDVPGATTMAVLVAANVVLIIQFYSVARFWEESMEISIDAQDKSSPS